MVYVWVIQHSHDAFNKKTDSFGVIAHAVSGIEEIAIKAKNGVVLIENA